MNGSSFNKERTDHLENVGFAPVLEYRSSLGLEHCFPWVGKCDVSFCEVLASAPWWAWLLSWSEK